MSDMEQIPTQSNTPKLGLDVVQTETALAKAEEFFEHGLTKIRSFGISILTDAESLEHGIAKLIKEGIDHAEEALGIDVTSPSEST